jgi:IS6 family transposase
MRTAHRSHRSTPPRSAFAGFRFPSEVIVLAVRWYLRFGLSYRDVEELLAERGVEVNHVTIYRWVLRFTPLLAEAARPCRHAVGSRWQVDETYVKVAGEWRYVYRATDQFGQSSTCSSPDAETPTPPAGAWSGPSGRPRSWPSRSPPIRRRSTRSCWRTCCQRPGTAPTSTPTTGSSATTGGCRRGCGRCDGLKQDRSARLIVAGHAFVQNLRRGHYELAVEEPPTGDWRSHSRSWPWRSDPESRSGLLPAVG